MAVQMEEQCCDVLQVAMEELRWEVLSGFKISRSFLRLLGIETVVLKVQMGKERRPTENQSYKDSD